MPVTFDYAGVYEAEYRNRTAFRRALVLVVAAGLFIIQPKLTLSILRECADA